MQFFRVFQRANFYKSITTNRQYDGEVSGLLQKANNTRENTQEKEKEKKEKKIFPDSPPSTYT